MVFQIDSFDVFLLWLSKFGLSEKHKKFEKNLPLKFDITQYRQI